jgi:hypothetical protein
MHTYIHTYIITYIHIHTYIHNHIHTYIYIYIYMSSYYYISSGLILLLGVYTTIQGEREIKIHIRIRTERWDGGWVARDSWCVTNR